MRRRRIPRLCALLIILCAALVGCGRLVPESDSITVYATFYPIYALADAVMRDVPNARLRCLVQPQDGCLRAYQLSDWDVARLENDADAVLLGGRGLESFESALLSWGSSGAAVSAVLYNLPLYNADAASHGDGEQESHLDGPNPHLYLSIDGARDIVESVAASMLSLDPAFADQYLENSRNAMATLDALRAETAEIVGDVAGTPVILMNEALIYAARDYGLNVAEWIDRESGTMDYDDALAARLEALLASEARVILIERQAPSAYVAALEAAGFAVARLDILSTHREDEGFEGYLEAQRANARALRAAIDKNREDRKP